MLTTVAFSLFLMLLSVWLVATHLRAEEPYKDERERDYLRRRRRRRLQCSGMIGVVGLLLLLGVFLEDSMASIIYMLGVTLLVFWIGLLAIADIISTRSHFAFERSRQMTERAKIEAELRKARRFAEEKSEK